MHTQAHTQAHPHLSPLHAHNATKVRPTDGLAVYRRARLDKVELDTETQLSPGANFRGASLRNVRLPAHFELTQLQLNGANLSDSVLDHCSMDCCILIDASLEACSIKGAHINGTDLTRATVQHSNLERALLCDVTAEALNLAGAQMAMCSMSRCALFNAIFFFFQISTSVQCKGRACVMPRSRGPLSMAHSFKRAVLPRVRCTKVHSPARRWLAHCCQVSGYGYESNRI